MNAATAYPRIQRICLALDDVEETVSHSRPVFKRRGRSMLMFMDNHHNDGRVAIWCKATAGAQDLLVHSDPSRFFVPPYVGHQGWVGVRLEGRPPWPVVEDLVRKAWETCGPAGKAGRRRAATASKGD